ncbi:MAG TPA: hypothetical protein IAD14_09005 [Candidatus Coprousia avicola]|nr:hypothetical protein [Candidatus Coprousia avicola]
MSLSPVVSRRSVPLFTERAAGLTSNALKLIAISAMFFDHFCLVFVDVGPVAGAWLRVPGRLAAPIMCYLISEGYAHTSHLGRYTLRLLVFAMISHVPYDFYFGLDPFRWTSVIWGLACGLVALAVAERREVPLWARVVFVLACCVVADPADWSYVGVLWVVGFGLMRGRFALQMLAFAVVGLALYAVPGVLEGGPLQAYRFGILLTIPVLACYNGRLGRRIPAVKYGFYMFYPAHLLVLWGLRLLMGV